MKKLTERWALEDDIETTLTPTAQPRWITDNLEGYDGDPPPTVDDEPEAE